VIYIVYKLSLNSFL